MITQPVAAQPTLSPKGSELRDRPRIDIGRPGWYRGRVAEVRRLGAHRLLLLDEVARDGSALAVWVSSVAIDAECSGKWAKLLDTKPLPTLAVRFRSRFPCCSDQDPLVADVHFPEDIALAEPTEPPVA